MALQELMPVAGVGPADHMLGDVLDSTTNGIQVQAMLPSSVGSSVFDSCGNSTPTYVQHISGNESTPPSVASALRSVPVPAQRPCPLNRPCGRANDVVQAGSMEIPPAGMPVQRRSGNSKNMCPHCNKTFFSHKGLQQHLIIHTDQKPHVCEICQKAFRFKSNLFEHKSLHSGLQPYVCKICSKSCRLKGNLKKHLKTHQKNGELEDLEKACREIVSMRARKGFVDVKDDESEPEQDDYADYMIEESDSPSAKVVPMPNDKELSERKSRSSGSSRRSKEKGGVHVPSTAFHPTGASSSQDVLAAYSHGLPPGTSAYDALAYDSMGIIPFDNHGYNPYASVGLPSTLDYQQMTVTAAAMSMDPKGSLSHLGYHPQSLSGYHVPSTQSMQPEKSDVRVMPAPSHHVPSSDRKYTAHHLPSNLPPTTTGGRAPATASMQSSESRHLPPSGSSKPQTASTPNHTPPKASSSGDRMNRLWQEFRNIAFENVSQQYACKACGAAHRYRAELRRHLREQHPDSKTCETCLVVFDSDAKFKDHDERHKRIHKYLRSDSLRPKRISIA